MKATLENSPDLTKDKDTIILREAWKDIQDATSLLNYVTEIHKRGIKHTEKAAQMITTAYFRLESLSANKEDD